MHRETSGENQKEETMKVRGDIMIKIKNNSRLSYKVMGSIIDKFMSEDGYTMYEGKKDHIYFEHNEKHYKLDVTYGKRDTTYIFSNAR